MARNGRNGEVFPVFIPRAFILTVDKGKHGTSSGGYPRVVLDGLARLSRRVCACPLSRQCFTSVPGAFISTVDNSRGRHGTSSGGCAAFLVNIIVFVNIMINELYHLASHLHFTVPMTTAFHPHIHSSPDPWSSFPTVNPHSILRTPTCSRPFPHLVISFPPTGLFPSQNADSVHYVK